jgi:hypothetical protein
MPTPTEVAHMVLATHTALEPGTQFLSGNFHLSSPQHITPNSWDTMLGLCEQFGNPSLVPTVACAFSNIYT